MFVNNNRTALKRKALAPLVQGPGNYFEREGYRLQTEEAREKRDSISDEENTIVGFSERPVWREPQPYLRDDSKTYSQLA